MNPDYSTLMDNLIVPMLMFLLFAFAIIGWAMAIQLNKEVTDLRKRLGRELDMEPRWDMFSEARENIFSVIIMLKKKLVEPKEKYITNLQRLSLHIVRPALIQLGSIIMLKLIMNVRSLVSVLRIY